MPGGKPRRLRNVRTHWPGCADVQALDGSGNSPGRVTFRDEPVSSPARWATLPLVSTFSALSALPYEHLERATAGPRAELRRQLLAADVHEMPQWETFDVTGPIPFTDLRGHTWFEYRATVETRRPFDVATTVSTPGHVPTESR
jgi:hypothetical protein